MGKPSGQLLRVRQVMEGAQERRDSKRAPCRQVCLFKLTKFVDKSTVKLTTGSGHAINKSVKGMLLLLPVPLHRRQVVEIQVPSEARETLSTKFGESVLGPAHFGKRPIQDVLGGHSLFL